MKTQQVIDPFEIWGKFFSGAINFSGKASRSDYLWSRLLVLAILLLCYTCVIKFGYFGTIVLIVVSLALLLPSMSLFMRRCNDIGVPQGWKGIMYALWFAVPFLIDVVFCLYPSYNNKKKIKTKSAKKAMKTNHSQGHKISLKAIITLCVCYEILIILILADYNGVCDAIFSYDFCTYEGFQYLVMCLFVPAIVGVIYIWRQELTDFVKKWRIRSN